MDRPESTPEKAGSRDATLVALAALAASAAGILNDFVYDDIPIIRDNVRLHSLANIWDIVSRPYWPPPLVEQLYRPFAVLLLAVQYVVGGGSPLVFRLVSYALYAACAVAFFRLARGFVSRNAALAAALLFAVHPVHVEAVALGVNQGELIVGLAAMMMVTRYVECRRAGGLRTSDWLLLAGCYAVAVLTKENGFVLPALLVAAELTVLHTDPLDERIRRLWRGYAALGAVAVAALVARATVLSGLVGASPAQALRGLNVGQRALAMLQVVPMWLRLFVWPQHLRADYAPGEIALPASVGLAEVVGAALVVAAIWFVIEARRRQPVAAFGVAWCVIGLLPVSNLIPTGIMLAERTLFLPSVGFLLGVGACGEAVARQRRWRPDAVRRALIWSVVILFALGLGRSANRHSVWNSAHVVVVGPSP